MNTVNRKTYCQRLRCWLILFVLVGFGYSLNAQIGKDHIRIISGGPEYTIIIDQEFAGEPHRFGGGTQMGPTRDYTGAIFNLVTVFNPGDKFGLFSFGGTFLDDGVSVYRVEEGDVFSWEGIQSGEFEELSGGNPFGGLNRGDTIDLTTPAFLGFLTPAKSIVNGELAFGGGRIRGIGWTKIEMGSLVPGEIGIRLLDHAMNYGGDSIVVGESHRDPHEGLVPVSRFGELEPLIPSPDQFGSWQSGDFDGDGDLDFLMSGEGGYQLWKQDESNEFSAFTGASITDVGPTIDVGDVDNDGDLDVWVLIQGFNAEDPSFSLWMNQGDGSFVHSDQVLPASSAIYLQDLDNDGDLDALVNVYINVFQSKFQTWVNDGTGTFVEHSTLPGSCGPFGAPADLGDLNGDGYDDLFYNCEGLNRVAFNQGDGSFIDSGKSYMNTDVLTIFPGLNVSLGDFDGDGDLDAVVPYESLVTELWINDGEGRFRIGQSHLGAEGQAVAVGDIDTDGDDDMLLYTNEGRFSINDPSSFVLFWNEGPDLFIRGVSFQVDHARSIPQLLDVDQDDDLDIVFRNERGLIVFRQSIDWVEPTPPEDGIVIEDEGLKRGLLEALGKKLTEFVTEEDLLGLKELDLSRARRGTGAPVIEDLSLLEKAINLESLNLSGGGSFGFGNAIPSFDTGDLKFLSFMKQLKHLQLQGNRLSELELPEGMSNLVELNVSDNLLTELELPSGLTHLKDFQLSRNQIKQLSFPEDMSALEILWAESNKIQLLHFPETQIHLKRLFLTGNRMRSLKLPSGASMLEWLSLGGNVFASNIEFPDNPSKLFYLSLGNSLQRIGDYDFLATLTGLEQLHVIDAEFDIARLTAPIPSLERLELDLQSGTRFVLPAGYESLVDLRVSGNQLTHFELPTDLHRVEQLNVFSERISELHLPEGLTSLKYFSFYGGRLEHITLSSDMTRLQGLELTRNRIETLVIPEGVGSNTEFPPNVSLWENPILSVKAPAQWSKGINANRAFIRADKIAFDRSGNFQFLVSGQFGTVVIEKSLDMKNWKEVGRVQITNPGVVQRFRESNAFSDPHGFYRVRSPR